MLSVRVICGSLVSAGSARVGSRELARFCPTVELNSSLPELSAPPYGTSEASDMHWLLLVQCFKAGSAAVKPAAVWHVAIRRQAVLQAAAPSREERVPYWPGDAVVDSLVAEPLCSPERVPCSLHGGCGASTCWTASG